MQIELLALIRQSVPYLNGVIPGHPDFISQVAGIAGARDIDRNPCNFSARHTEIFQIRDVGLGNRFQQLRGGWTLQRESRNLLGDVFDLHIHVQTVLPEPAQARIGGCPAINVLLEMRDRAVIDDLAILVAPAAVDNLPDFHLVDVARDDAIHETGRVFAGDQILVERRDVDQRTSVPDRVVLVLVVHFVDADRVISGPLAIIQAITKGERSLVKRGSDGQSEFLKSEFNSNPDYCMRAEERQLVWSDDWKSPGHRNQQTNW